MTSNGAQHYVLCEGYDDRAFLASVFEHLGLASMRSEAGRGPLVDAWQDQLKGGIYGFRHPSGTSPMVRLEEVKGLSKMARVARIALDGHTTKPLASLTLVRDDDSEVGETPLDVASWVRGIFPNEGVAKTTANTFEVRGVRVNVIVWRVDGDVSREGVPSKQTLERLVCSALADVDPSRASSVHRWLDDPPPASDVNDPKAIVGSYVAKWYAEDRLDAFYRGVVRDEALLEKVRPSLESTGAWRVSSELAGVPAP